MDVLRRLPIEALMARSWRKQLSVLLVVTAVTVIDLQLLDAYVEISLTVVTLLGTALSFFIGFVNSHAYGRWWEARTIWGDLLNNSRSFGRMVLSFIVPEGGNADSTEYVRDLQTRLIHRHIAMIRATRSRLREDGSQDYLDYLDEDDRAAIANQSHVPSALLLRQSTELTQATAIVAGPARCLDVRLLAQINVVLNNLIGSVGNSERIQSTPFPPYYLTLVQLAVGLFLILFPMAIDNTVGYWAILYAYLLGTMFMLIFQAGERLMNPFDDRHGGVAISSITRAIEIDLLQQLGSEDVPPPLEPIDGLYLM